MNAYRRQTINEKLEEAIADAENHRVGLGVNATIVSQTALQSSGPKTDADGHTSRARLSRLVL